MKLLRIFALLLISNGLLAFTPLPLNQVYQLKVYPEDNETIVADWTIQPGYSLYRHKISLSTAQPSVSQLGIPLLPPGIPEYNKAIGHYQVFQNNLRLGIPVVNTTSHVVRLHVHYQGCANLGFCYPPVDQWFKVNLNGPYGVAAEKISAPKTWHQAIKPLLPLHHLNRLLSHKSLWLIIISFIGFGILIAFTPCILPMVPILASVVLGQKNTAHKRAFALSLSYVFGMSLTYAAAGILFSVLGQSLQVWLQQTWALVLFAAIFLLMALSMFGAFNIKLPASWQNKLHQINNKQQSGHLLSVFLMGILATLILSPCVTPPLVAVLSFVSAQGSLLVGAIALFSLGIGIGIPLIILVMLGQRFLPKTGQWMQAIKTLLGMLMLAVCIGVINRVLPSAIGLGLWAVFALGVALLLGTFSSGRGLWHYLKKLLGLLSFVYAILLGIGIYQGDASLLQPLSWQQHNKAPALFKTVHNLQQVLAVIKQAKKPVLLDFYADWCTACKEMDLLTFSNPQVIHALKSYTLIRVDITANNAASEQVMQHLGVIAPPTLFIFAHGKPLGSAIIGEQSSDSLLHRLRSLSANKGDNR